MKPPAELHRQLPVEPPRARQVPAEHELHGTQWTDEFAWLRAGHALATSSIQRISFDEAACALSLEPLLEFDAKAFHFGYESPSTPDQTWHFDMKSGERSLLKQEIIPSGHDPKHYVVKRLYAESPDGEQVPLTLLHHRQRRSGRKLSSLPDFPASVIVKLQREYRTPADRFGWNQRLISQGPHGLGSRLRTLSLVLNLHWVWLGQSRCDSNSVLHALVTARKIYTLEPLPIILLICILV